MAYTNFNQDELFDLVQLLSGEQMFEFGPGSDPQHLYNAMYESANSPEGAALVEEIQKATSGLSKYNVNSTDIIKFRTQVTEDPYGFVADVDNFISNNPSIDPSSIAKFIHTQLGYTEEQIASDHAVIDELATANPDATAQDLTSAVQEIYEPDVVGFNNPSTSLERIPEIRQIVDPITNTDRPDMPAVPNGGNLPLIGSFSTATDPEIIAGVNVHIMQSSTNLTDLVTEKYGIEDAGEAHRAAAIIARANGIEDPSAVNSGRPVFIPNSREMLEQAAGNSNLKLDSMTTDTNQSQTIETMNTLLADPSKMIEMESSELESLLNKADPETLASFQSSLLQSESFHNLMEERLGGDLANGSQGLVELQTLMTGSGLYNRGIDGLNGSGTSAGIERFNNLEAATGEPSPLVDDKISAYSAGDKLASMMGIGTPENNAVETSVKPMARPTDLAMGG